MEHIEGKTINAIGNKRLTRSVNRLAKMSGKQIKKILKG